MLNGYEAPETPVFSLCCSDVILMQSNPPLSPGCECMSGMGGPLKSFPLHCSINRLVLCREVIQLHCWVLPVCECVCVFACVCFLLAWNEPHQYSSLNSFSPALFYLLNFFPYRPLLLLYIFFAASKLNLCCSALHSSMSACFT